MSANIPFTPSVVQYDPPRAYVLDIVPTVGSVLDRLRMFTDFYALVERSGQQKLYNVSPVTVFVPRKFVFDYDMTQSDAIEYVRMLTVTKRLNSTAMKYSPVYILKTMATSFSMTIESSALVTTVDSVPITESYECLNGCIHVLG